MTCVRRTVAALACTAALVLLAVPPAAADAVADFYAGKRISVQVGFATGGGYDIYARTLARFMPRHIPGNPTMVVQNMPGAGSMKAANYIYGVAPKDGTQFGTFARGIPIDPVLGNTSGVEFEATKFNWIGSIANEVGVCAFMTSSNIKTWDDMRAKPVIIGSSGAGADSHVMPLMLKNMFNLPMKIVAGYQGGGADLVLAMERREIDGRCGWSWTSLLSQHKRLYDQKQIDIVVQLALQKHDDLPNVPLVLDITNDPKQKAALKLVLSRQHIARPFTAPPGVPEDRVKALRAAFNATMKDPDFIAEAKKQDLDVFPVAGAEITALLQELYTTPADVVKLAQEVSRETP
jgi:tripartite-type tricarboxylate transporter receptor subunit TctC